MAISNHIFDVNGKIVIRELIIFLMKSMSFNTKTITNNITCEVSNGQQWNSNSMKDSTCFCIKFNKRYYSKVCNDVTHSYCFECKFLLFDCTSSQTQPWRYVLEEKKGNKDIDNNIQCVLFGLRHSCLIERHIDHE